jgi:hypothetical protein
MGQATNLYLAEILLPLMPSCSRHQESHDILRQMNSVWPLAESHEYID